MEAAAKISREDMSARKFHALAGRVKEGRVSRRPPTIALVLAGAPRKVTAGSCGMDRQALRASLIAVAVGLGAPPGTNGTACQRHVACHQGPLPVFGNHGSFPAGTHVGVQHRTYTLLRGDFFAFRFVSDFCARQHIDSIDQFFPD